MRGSMRDDEELSERTSGSWEMTEWIWRSRCRDVPGLGIGHKGGRGRIDSVQFSPVVRSENWKLV